MREKYFYLCELIALFFNNKSCKTGKKKNSYCKIGRTLINDVGVF
jgi:hypothetical protein